MRWFHRVFQNSRAESELDRELRCHLDRQVADYVAGGMGPEEARRRARLEFGGLERVKEEVRDAWWERQLDNLLNDFRYALRNLRKDSRFALVAIFTLALGIASTTAMFSVVYNLLFDPFPYKAADRLTVISIHDIKQGGYESRDSFSIPEFLEYRRQNHVFEDMVGCDVTNAQFADGGGTRTFTASHVTGNTFEFYGIPPLMGRGITPGDANPGAPPVFVMNYKLWKSEFNRDPRILGKSYFVEGRERTVVGIMPPRFQVCSGRLWIPVALSPAEGTTVAGDIPVHLWTVGRLKPGTTRRAAAADIEVIARRLSKIYPRDYPEQFTVNAQNLLDMGRLKVMLYALLGAVIILLLIACANVANLLLAKASMREQEIAVRVSLGASPSRVIRQLLAESFVLASLACFAGCVLAYFGLKGISATIPQEPLPDEAVIGFNPVVMAFAVATSLLTTLVCGLSPAIHAVRGNLQQRLMGSGKGVNAPSLHGRFRSGLVIAEVALSVVLLAGAGLLMRSFMALTSIDLGFNPKPILFAMLAVPQDRHETVEEKKLFFEEALSRVKALPGVITAAAAYSLPPVSVHSSDATLPGKKHAEHWYTRLELCSAGYFETLGLQLQRGSFFSESDIASARQVVVVNETLARTFFAKEDPIGQKVKFNSLDEIPDAPHDAYFEIIGVVRDFSNRNAPYPPMPEALLPYTITAHGDRVLLARTTERPESLLPAVRREIWAVDRNIVITDTGSLQELLAYSYTEPRFDLITSGAFAGIGLLLVVVGVFSVTAYTVSLRTNEIGIRMALGATQDSILKMVLTKGLRLVAAGVGIGLLVSFGLTRFIASQIWGVSVTDPITFVFVVAIVSLVGFLACLFPARRATKVDPLVALHYE